MRHYLHLPLCRVLPWAVLTMNITDTARSCSGGPQQLLSHLHWSLVLGKQLMLVQRPSAFQCHWCWAAFPFPKSVLGRLADLPAANRATAPLFICRVSLHTILHTRFTCLVPVRPKQLHKTYWKRSIIEKKLETRLLVKQSSSLLSFTRSGAKRQFWSRRNFVESCGGVSRAAQEALMWVRNGLESLNMLFEL